MCWYTLWKSLIDFRECDPWKLINRGNGKFCRKSLTKKLQHKICQFCSVSIKELGQIVTLANKNLFLWRHLEISSVLLFSKVSGSAQMMETLNHIGMLRPFCRISIIDCCQDCVLLSSTHVLLTQSHSCTHSVWFWSAITFTVVAVICFAQHFRIMLFDDVSNIGSAAIT